MEVVLIIVGAIASLFLAVAYEYLYKVCRRKNPLKIEVTRSQTPPMWFATNDQPPKDIALGQDYESKIIESAAFCGFGKINLRISNVSKDVVYIKDIRVLKAPIVYPYQYRVRTIPQGSSEVIRLLTHLDDKTSSFTLSLNNRFEKNAQYFESGNRIKIAPGEVEYLYLSFTTIQQSWSFNCSMSYEINNKEKITERLFDKDFVIAPYMPNRLKQDYCYFLECVNPKYPKFEDARYFSSEEENSKQDKSALNTSSSLAYLEDLSK